MLLVSPGAVVSWDWNLTLDMSCSLGATSTILWARLCHAAPKQENLPKLWPGLQNISSICGTRNVHEIALDHEIAFECKSTDPWLSLQQRAKLHSRLLWCPPWLWTLSCQASAQWKADRFCKVRSLITSSPQGKYRKHREASKKYPKNICIKEDKGLQYKRIKHNHSHRQGVV